jgi:hypothetical protein
MTTASFSGNTTWKPPSGSRLETAFSRLRIGSSCCFPSDFIEGDFNQSAFIEGDPTKRGFIECGSVKSGLATSDWIEHGMRPLLVSLQPHPTSP